eukprot:TRINITY_DN2515_c0_g1::TRINITY_DN2515_c0_g1_i1::g.19455::m.19455 TRINITY_DN2515_c0_g1::TRINITY_DN2515_c0_g1_i1::g.19455  ORF type:complete len:657 (-),score=195.19,sp/Q6GM29/SAC1_XENLA/38.33/6e-111,Syja_N/PF02383.13/4.7e-78 TRINITY_DN2515_c0_g1_i1:46-2016(-)
MNTSPKQLVYDSFYIYTHRNNIDIVPSSGDATHFVTFDRDNGSSSIQEIGIRETRGKPEDATAGHAIFGVIRLLAGPYILLVTDRKLVLNQIDGHPICKVEEIKILRVLRSDSFLSDEQRAYEAQYLALLESALKMHFYYSISFDVTHTQQRIAGLTPEQKALPLADRADGRFFWNSHLCSDFAHPVLKRFITPMMSGYVEAVSNVQVGDRNVTVVLISRRSRYRQGTRFNVRGVSPNGEAANYAETEQVVLHPDGSLTANVQIRGSIPLMWRQYVTGRYMPESEMLTSSVMAPEQVHAFSSHFKEQVDKYMNVMCVNLIDKKNKHGQLMLGDAYKAHVDNLNNSHVHYVWFDFHHECRKMKYGNLSKLIDSVRSEIERYGHFVRDPAGRVQSMQTGVFRTNCMDNLDRTNVVQSLFARQSVLHQCGAQGGSSILDSPYPAFERWFKSAWANHADLISTLYAGTGALKTDFTRTGKRTLMGALNDGQNSCVRYYLNNFRDGQRQDSVDLLLGLYTPSVDAPSPLKQSVLQSIAQIFIIRLLLLLLLFLWCLITYGPKKALVGFERSSRRFLDTPRLVPQDHTRSGTSTPASRTPLPAPSTVLPASVSTSGSGSGSGGATSGASAASAAAPVFKHNTVVPVTSDPSVSTTSTHLHQQ